MTISTMHSSDQVLGLGLYIYWDVCVHIWIDMQAFD